MNCMVIPACMLLLLQSCCTHACLPVEFSRPAEISVPAAACMYQILLAAYPGIIMIITGDSDIKAIIAIFPPPPTLRGLLDMRPPLCLTRREDDGDYVLCWRGEPFARAPIAILGGCENMGRVVAPCKPGLKSRARDNSFSWA